ncbi:unnamed protein product [Musa acuminata subsp. burmannicoides]
MSSGQACDLHECSLFVIFFIHDFTLHGQEHGSLSTLLIHDLVHGLFAYCNINKKR